MTDEHDLAGLDEKIGRLGRNLARLTEHELTATFPVIVHQPGWTTPAEAALVHASLDALTVHTEMIALQMDHLLAAARQVGAQ